MVRLTWQVLEDAWWLDSLMHSHNKLPALMGSRSLDIQVRKEKKKKKSTSLKRWYCRYWKRWHTREEDDQGLRDERFGNPSLPYSLWSPAKLLGKEGIDVNPLATCELWSQSMMIRRWISRIFDEVLWGLARWWYRQLGRSTCVSIRCMKALCMPTLSHKVLCGITRRVLVRAWANRHRVVFFSDKCKWLLIPGILILG